MKRIIICAFITLVLLILGTASLCCTDNAAREAENTIDSMTESFGEGDIAGARSLTMKLSRQWEDYVRNDPFIVGRDNAEAIIVAFARLESLAREESGEFITECAAAKKMVELFREKNSLSLRNIF